MWKLVVVSLVLLILSCGKLKGPKGDAGPVGLPGAPGSAGPKGADGTTITVVQFCPATFVPTYPSTFPEVGLVINGVMYGVYSANGGFLTPLPPGTYTSNGIGVSCTFRINADNTVEAL